MKAVSCDGCGTVLLLDTSSGREDSAGEYSAWIVIEAGGLSYEACTRVCAVGLLADGGALAAAVDAHLAVVSEIARTIRGDDGSGQEAEHG